MIHAIKILFVLIILLMCKDIYCLEQESEHFVFHFEVVDSSIIDDLSSRLETNYTKITGDLRMTLPEKTHVYIYPDLQAFHNAIGWPDAPDWLCGIGGTSISVVSPLNPGPQHTYDEMINNVILHEFVHICTNKINYNRIAWVTEGYALYNAGPFYSNSSVVAAYNRLGKIPALDELSDFNRFVSLSGYQIAPTIFRFATEKFGKDAVFNFMYNPADFSVFSGLTKAEFQEQWFNYVKVNYLGFTSADCQPDLNMFSLLQNYPNPFNPLTNFIFQIADSHHDGQVGFVSLKIFDITGNQVAELINEQKPAGKYSISWDAGNLSSGVYFFKLQSGNSAITKKLVLMK